MDERLEGAEHCSSSKHKNSSNKPTNIVLMYVLFRVRNKAKTLSRALQLGQARGPSAVRLSVQMNIKIV